MAIEEQEPQPALLSKSKEPLKWAASILLALVVACSGCGFFLTVGLVARGELTAEVLGIELRLWAIREKKETGLGLDRSHEVLQPDRRCIHHDVTLLLWKPALDLQNIAYDDCRKSSLRASFDSHFGSADASLSVRSGCSQHLCLGQRRCGAPVTLSCYNQGSTWPR